MFALGICYCITHQVGPTTLVLGEKPQKYGLAVSLLERLYDLYQKQGPDAQPYYARLQTNFRSHRQIVNLAEQIAYKMPMDYRSDTTVHPEAKFPLLFICSSLDRELKEVKSNINLKEAEIALRQASHFLKTWPVSKWGEKDASQMCFLSPHRGQV